jgi:hypothetical protein
VSRRPEIVSPGLANLFRLDMVTVDCFL